MLIDIQYKTYLGYDAATKLHRYEFDITDGEFGSVVGEGAGAGLVGAGFTSRGATRAQVGAGAVIAEYGKRNLNVAPNLVKLLLIYNKRYGYSIQQLIEWWMLYQPLFPQYKEELNKYLTLA